MIAMPERVEVTIDKEIDARGSFRPGPLMELICEVRGMPVGSVLAVLSSDPGSARNPTLDSQGQARISRRFPRAGLYTIRDA